MMKLMAFGLIWVLAGLVVGWVMGSAARLGGEDDDVEREMTPDWTAIEHGERRNN